jgi:hypothetical protein
MAAAAFADALLDPASVFDTPADVVSHPGLRDDQKRVILLAWANDALGLEWADARDLTDFAPVAHLDALLEALEPLDPKAAADYRAVRKHVRSESARRKRKLT